MLLMVDEPPAGRTGHGGRPVRWQTGAVARPWPPAGPRPSAPPTRAAAQTLPWARMKAGATRHRPLACFPPGDAARAQWHAQTSREGDHDMPIPQVTDRIKE